MIPRRTRSRPSSYRAIVTSLAKLAKEHDLPQQTAPWPGFLPEKLALTTPLVSQDAKVTR